VAAAAGSQHSGYLTGHVPAARLAEGLERFMLSRFSGSDPCALVAQQDRRVVAAHCKGDAFPVGSKALLPLYDHLGPDVGSRNDLGAITEFELHGRPHVGGLQVLGALGWTVAIWRPRAAAYSALDRLQRDVIVVLAAVFLLSVVLAVLVAGAITQPIRRLSHQVSQIARRDWKNVSFKPHREDEIGELSRSMEFMVQSLESTEAQIARAAELRGNLSRFLSKELVEGIVNGGHSLELGGTRKEVTVVFADVVHFTGLAERLPPEQVVSLLNELFSMLSEVVFRHGGVVDKFVGDCLMAVWGSAVPDHEHAARAVEAAIDMLRFLETANLDWVRRYDVRLELAIGINSGDALVGNVGSTKRMEYTVIGDTVNVAARLEKLAMAGQLLMGERTRELINPDAPVVDLGPQSLFGKGILARVYRMELD
jgi:adenylate cyclase